MFQRICTVPDAGGNARRLYAIYGTDDSLLACIDERYFERRWFDDLLELPTVSSPPTSTGSGCAMGNRRRGAFRGGNGAGPGAS